MATISTVATNGASALQRLWKVVDHKYNAHTIGNCCEPFSGFTGFCDNYKHSKFLERIWTLYGKFQRTWIRVCFGYEKNGPYLES